LKSSNYLKSKYKVSGLGFLFYEGSYVRVFAVFKKGLHKNSISKCLSYGKTFKSQPTL